jgi:hypothetical protein
MEVPGRTLLLQEFSGFYYDGRVVAGKGKEAGSFTEPGMRGEAATGFFFIQGRYGLTDDIALALVHCIEGETGQCRN